MAKELLSRKDVPVELTWDLSLIYATEEDMYADLAKLEKLRDEMVSSYKGKLNSAETIVKCLDDYRKLYELAVLII